MWRRVNRRSEARLDERRSAPDNLAVTLRLPAVAAVGLRTSPSPTESTVDCRAASGKPAGLYYGFARTKQDAARAKPARAASPP